MSIISQNRLIYSIMKRKILTTFTTFIMNLSFFSLLGGIMVFLAMYLYAGSQLPAVETLKDVRLETPMSVYTKDQQLFTQFGEIRRIPLSFKNIPDKLNQALIATEDRRFYDHGGVDAVGFARAVFLLLSTGRMDGGGGSTITMQLARNFFLTFDQTFTRKTKEIFLSWKIERTFTKKEILTLYWNKIEFSNRAHGVGAASQVYYGTTVDKLTLPQLAILAGIPKGPTTHNPLSNPEKAFNRRNHVLKRMNIEGYINQAELEEASSSPLTASYHGPRVTVRAPYLAEMIRREMINRFGKEKAYTAGFKVFTTLDSKLQQVSRRSLRQSLVDYDRRHGFRGVERHFNEAQQLLLTLNQIISLDENTEINNLVVDPEMSPQATFDYQPLNSILNDIPILGDLIPALVLSVDEKSVDILLKKTDNQTLISKQLVTIEWPGLSWARPFINESMRGKKPRTASEILKSGDQIRTYQDKEGNWQLAQLPEVSAAFVAIKPQDGAITSLVGGFDFDYSKFNNVIQARRQPGSNIKPFIYSAALEKGYTAATVVNDAPFTKVDANNENIWRPKNSSGNYKGPTRLRKALTSSTNLVSIRLLDDIGPQYAVNYLSNLGFDKERMPAYNSLALGAADFTPLEVAGGFAAFANGGYRIEPYFINRIEDSNGNVVFEQQPLTVCEQCEKILEKEGRNHQTNQPSNPLLLHASKLSISYENAEASLLAEIDAEIDSKIENENPSQEIDGRLFNADIENTNNSDLPQNKPLQNNAIEIKQISEFQLDSNKPLNFIPRFAIDENFIAPRVMAKDNVFILNSMMQDVIHRGTAAPILRRTKSSLLKRRDLAGKTGTTNEAKDAWFSGYNGDFVATAWVGYSDYQRGLGNNEFGGKAALPIWQGFMEQALVGKPANDLKQPPGLVTAKIDPATGLLAPAGMKGAIFEIFRQRFIPKKLATPDIVDPFNEDVTEDKETIF